MSVTILIVAGGNRPEPTVTAAIGPVDRVIAADRGADHARALGLAVDLVVGDLDSASPGVIESWRAAGADIEEHPAAKDKTDLELALIRAMEMDPTRVVAVGIGGGRFDHQAGNLLALADAARSGVEIDGLVGTARVSVVAPRRRLSGSPGELISLLPLLGTARGVTTEGLEFPLRSEPLTAGSSRGVSNRFVADRATVTVDDGVLVAIQPFALLGGVEGGEIEVGGVEGGEQDEAAMVGSAASDSMAVPDGGAPG